MRSSGVYFIMQIDFLIYRHCPPDFVALYIGDEVDVLRIHTKVRVDSRLTDECCGRRQGPAGLACIYSPFF